jgi:hypothetical protein
LTGRGVAGCAANGKQPGFVPLDLHRCPGRAPADSSLHCHDPEVGLLPVVRLAAVPGVCVEFLQIGCFLVHRRQAIVEDAAVLLVVGSYGDIDDQLKWVLRIGRFGGVQHESTECLSVLLAIGCLRIIGRLERIAADLVACTHGELVVDAREVLHEDAPNDAVDLDGLVIGLERVNHPGVQLAQPLQGRIDITLPQPVDELTRRLRLNKGREAVGVLRLFGLAEDPPHAKHHFNQ